MKVKIKNKFSKKFFLGIFSMLIFSVFSFISFFPLITNAAAGVPALINFQGRLLDSSGNLLGGTGGTDYCYKFSIYDAVSGGTKTWPAGSPSTMTINTREGVFNANVGDTVAGGDTLDLAFTDDQAFMNVEVATKVGATCAPGDGAESFETLSPRQRIVSSAFAINSKTVGGFTPAQSATGSQIPALTSGSLVLGDTNPGLRVTGSNTLTFQSGVTGDIQFYSSSNKITSSGALTIAGGFTSSSGTVTLGGLGGGGSQCLQVDNSGVVSGTGSSCGAGSVTWNSLTNPTGTQSLTFDDGELNNWTVSSDTETFQTITANSLTTGKVLSISSSSLSSGSLVDLTVTGTAGLTNQKGLNISLSGANGTGAQITYGAYISNTHTGAGTNIGLYVDASAAGGGNSYAAIFRNGSVGIGTSAPRGILDVNNDGNNGDAYIDILDNVFIGDYTANGSNVYLTVNGDSPSAGFIFRNGNVGIGDTNPASLFTVGSGDLFQVNSSGDILTPAGENLSITTGTTGVLTLDTGTTGNVNLGTGNNGKDINIGTGTGGNLISIGTDDTNGDAIYIGSASDELTLTGSSTSNFTFDGILVDTTEFNLLNNGIERADLTTQGTATDEYCLTSETGGGALMEWQACGGGAVTWNSLTNPTGTQSLTFDDAELNSWTVSSDTETFQTITANSLTTGKVLAISSSSLSSGSLVDLTVTGTAGLTNQKGLNISLSGANSTGAQITYGAYISNTHTGSGTNVGLYAEATGGSTNYAALFNGNVQFTNVANRAISIANTSGANGKDLTITSGGSSSGGFNGGNLNLVASDGNLSNGGTVNIISGSSESGGNINITAGDGSPGSGDGGSVVINPGLSSGGPLPGNIVLSNLQGKVTIGSTTATSLFNVGSSAQFQVNSSGAIAAATGITSSGTITFSGLNSTGIVHTNGSGVLSTSLVAQGDLLTQGTATDEYCLTSETGGGALMEWQACGGGAVTWNSLTNPTGTQSLTFDDGELNNWTVSSDTETFQTITANSLTTGKVLSISSSSLTTGSLIDLAITGTAGLTNQKGLNISTSGANATSGQTTYGADVSNTHTGTNSQNNGIRASATSGASSNRGILALASGTGSSNNYGVMAQADNGNYAAGISAAAYSATTTVGIEAAASFGTYNTGINSYVSGGTDGTGIVADVSGATNTNIGINIIVSGAATTNTGLIIDVSGATTNYAALFSGGNVGIGGDATPDNLFSVGTTSQFQVNSSGAIAAATGITTTGTISLTSANTNQTGTSSAFAGNFNSLTTGTGMNLESSSLSSGSLVNLAVTGTAAASNTQRVLNISTSGANATSNQTTYGGYFSNTHTGTGANNNGIYAEARNSTNQNIGIRGYAASAASGVNTGIRGTAENGTNSIGISGEAYGNGLVGSTATGIEAGSNYGDYNYGISTWANGGIDGTGIYSDVSGATGTSKGLYTSVFGSGTNIGIDVSVGSGSTNYSGIFDGGNFGIGDTTPIGLLTVGSGDLFQVNSSGDILTPAGENLSIITGTTGVLTLDTGTTGAVNIGTGASGKTINIGTNNSVADTLNLGSALDTFTITGNSSSAFVLNAVNVSASEFNVLDAGIERADLTTQGTATDEYCLTSETGGGALMEWQACGGGGGSLTVGTSAIASGGANRVLFENGSNVLSESASFTYDGTTLGVDTASTVASNKSLNISQTGATSGTDYAGYFSNTGAATANVGLYVTASGGTTNLGLNVDAGQVLIGGTTLTTGTTSKLNIVATNSSNGATTAVAGIHGDYTFTNGGASSFVQVGNRFVFNNTPTTNANTMVGEILRVVDNTILANLVRGLEITANAGSNTAGTNTGLRTTGATFGIQAITNGSAGAVSLPAAIYGENTGTTQGDILRLYSTTITSAPQIAQFYHSTSSFSGTGLLMDFASGSGTFSGNFVDFQKNNTTLFRVTNEGVTSIGFSTSQASTSAVCSTLANATAPTADTLYELRDCGSSPVADYAEMYPVEEGAEFGDIVMTGDQFVNSYDLTNGIIDWEKVKGPVSKLVKSNQAYQNNIIGIVSDNYGDFSSTGHNIKQVDNPMPIALVGRIPVKISQNSNSIKAGDYITTSEEAGKGMKAIKSGFVLGKALSDWNPGESTVMVFVEQGYYDGISSTTFAGVDTTLSNEEQSKAILAKLILDKENNPLHNLEVSELLTDRVVAGLEVVTPNLYSEGVETKELTVEENALFEGLSNFEGDTKFLSSVSFEESVVFKAPPVFNRDTAGFALIKKGEKEIRVVFEKPYAVTPIVTTEITFEKLENPTEEDNTNLVNIFNNLFTSDIKSIVINKDNTGFTILLNKNAPEDIKFSWIALAVDDAKVFENEETGLSIIPSSNNIDNTTPPTNTENDTSVENTNEETNTENQNNTENITTENSTPENNSENNTNENNNEVSN